MYAFLVVVAALAGLVVGAYEGPTLTKWYAAWKASKALADAKAIIAKAEADAAALEAAHKAVAAAPKPVAPTGPTGATGA